MSYWYFSLLARAYFSRAAKICVWHVLFLFVSDHNPFSLHREPQPNVNAHVQLNTTRER